ncbi:hypothetical protein [Cesiribacter andamanensis]|uniref:N-acetyltransferase domain-containing protein n=1 Tax=Cesiribacter andamanensis AMV16 TaxID=1279009 RepID=M7NZL5_9BACT|nr:hypothetical protein [Cesiribacter andamanensis]EMR03779.1 hypothetical protein ADICEAN_01117 [Cesiribacter andamanensis AMV16]
MQATQSKKISYSRNVVVPVTDHLLEQDFLQVHVALNRQQPNWIRPLDTDVKAVFDPAKNKAYRRGEALRWLLYNPQGTPIGRIAAFVDPRYTNKGDGMRVGGIGFFDCIDQQEAANQLFNTAREWLQQRGMQAMDGPINFGERDRWWGLLVEGFQEPLYTMNYNPPYYQRLFEAYGFKNFYNQICWRLPVAGTSTQLQPKFYEAHARFAANPDFEARYLKTANLKQLAADFCTVYNKAWASHEGNKEMQPQQAYKLFSFMKPILDRRLVWFVYHKGEPVAMWINIPDINQLVKHLNGRFGWWAKIRFMVLKQLGVCTRFVGIIYGIVPQFQGSGVDYYMIVEAEKVIKAKTRYKEVELQWQGDFNPKMLNISRNLGAEQSRLLTTYRYLFDRQQPFHRHPVLQ